MNHLQDQLYLTLASMANFSYIYCIDAKAMLISKVEELAGAHQGEQILLE